MSVAAPNVQDIVMLAERINALVAQGYVVQLPGRAADQMYSAVRGAPGRGLAIFQDALRASIAARTNRDGDWLFYVPRNPPADRRGQVTATSSAPSGRPA